MTDIKTLDKAKEKLLQAQELINQGIDDNYYLELSKIHNTLEEFRAVLLQIKEAII